MNELTNAERETCFNVVADDRNTVHVFSDDPVMQRRIERVGGELVREEGPSKWYTLRADQLLLRKGKRKTAPLTMEQLAVLRAGRRENR